MNIDDTADKLENAVKEIRTFLLAELGYVEDIQYHLKQNDIYATLKEDYESEMDNSIDYLVRDLDPEYKNQHGAIDTLVEKLREVQEFRKEHLKGIEA